MSDSIIHPAVLANKQSIKYAMAKNKSAWLALYHKDAVLCDPVGISPLDPTGQGHHGIAAIEKFWDNIIAVSNITLTAGERIVSGQYACAVPMQAENDLGHGKKTRINMLATYEVDAQGLIIRMNAFWDWTHMQKQLDTLFGA